MNKVNEIIICRDNFRTQEEFENNIRDTIITLLKNQYIMTVDWDEAGLQILRISYNYNNREFGAVYPFWLNSRQEELLDSQTLDE